MKKFLAILFLICLPYTMITAQTYWVSGNVSTPTESVKNALVVFTNENDTTQSYSTLTDSLGNYSIGLLITSIEENTSVVPTEFELAQNYPNPFSTSTAISYKLNKESEVNVTIYDILGREVKKYLTKQQGTGIHGVTWDGKNNWGMRLSSGVYFYKVKVGNESQVKKMILHRSTKTSESLQIQNYMLGTTNARKEKITLSGGTYKITVKSNTTTTPLIVIQEFPNQQIESDTTLDYKVEEARVILGQSIDGVKMGDDSLTVIDKLGVPDTIYFADLDGYVFAYLDKNMHTFQLFIVLFPTSKPAVISIEATRAYEGKTKEGVEIGMYRNDALKLLGTPFFTDPGPPSTVDFYYTTDPLPGYYKSIFSFTYDDTDEKLISIRLDLESG